MTKYSELDKALRAKGWSDPEKHTRSSMLLSLEKRFDDTNRVEIYIIRQPYASPSGGENFADKVVFEGIYKDQSISGNKPKWISEYNSPVDGKYLDNLYSYILNNYK